MRISLIGYEANIKNRVGSNQYAFELIKALYQLDYKNQYCVYLPSLPLPDLPKERKNWHYRVVGPPRLWNIFGLPRALFQQRPKPDLVFNPGHYCPLFSPAPLVVSIMDLGYLRYPHQFTKPILAKLKFWTLLSIKRAVHILAISKSTKNDIIAYYPSRGRSLISVTYPGYDKEKFKKQEARGKIEEVKRKYKIKQNYILFLGTLKPNKNIEGLLQAFARLGEKNLQLVVAGRKGWMFKTIFEKVRKLGLGKQVIFTGFVEEGDVPVLMSGAEVFVMPSFWEGFGIPAIEAMACGTPVVVSNAGSLPEIVEEAGIVINPYDAKDIARGIKAAMENRERLIKKGFKQSRQFSWEKCAQETLKILEKTGGENV